MSDAEIIKGYRLQRLLHPGQVSQVYEVVEVISNRHYAMKILLPEKAKDKEQRNILFHEAEIGIKLHHPNVIRILKISRDQISAHFIMEFFPAGSLRARLMSKDPKDQEFLRQNAVKLVRQAATGLAYMHGKGYVHRDVKPDNLLMNGLGELKIIDFAISKRQLKGINRWFHRKGKASGTLSYMSPEQIRDEIPDPRADIYSFGITLFELFTGRPPFRGMSHADLIRKHIKEKPDSAKNLNPELNEDFSKLLDQMLQKAPQDRPKDMHEVMIALRGMRIFKNQPVDDEGMY